MPRRVLQYKRLGTQVGLSSVFAYHGRHIKVLPVSDKQRAGGE
ncbi:hypothetical protein [Methylomonas albis]|nr:hypothetical protein [Methylomonas albis]